MDYLKQQLICRINKDLEIWADDKQWILRRDRNIQRDFFYFTLEELIQDIFEMKMKECAFHDDEKNLKNMGKAIGRAKEFIHETIGPIMEGYKK